jgi:hypothetical protein
MEIPGLLTRPEEDLLAQADLDQGPESMQVLVGQPVRVVTGPLSGLTGVTHCEASDGRWLIAPHGWLPGAFLCIDGHQLSSEGIN